MKRGVQPVCHQWVLEVLHLQVLPLLQTWRQGSFVNFSSCYYLNLKFSFIVISFSPKSQKKFEKALNFFPHYFFLFLSQKCFFLTLPPSPSGNARGAKEPERRHSLYDSASRGQYKVSMNPGVNIKRM